MTPIRTFWFFKSRLYTKSRLINVNFHFDCKIMYLKSISYVKSRFIKSRLYCTWTSPPIHTHQWHHFFVSHESWKVMKISTLRTLRSEISLQSIRNCPYIHMCVCVSHTFWGKLQPGIGNEHWVVKRNFTAGCMMMLFLQSYSIHKWHTFGIHFLVYSKSRLNHRIASNVGFVIATDKPSVRLICHFCSGHLNSNGTDIHWINRNLA